MGIKELRNRIGITQKELADLLGLHFTAVSKWELGRTPVPEYRYSSLSKIFGVSEHELREELEGTPEPIESSSWETIVLGSDRLSVDEKLILMAIKGMADPSTAVVATTMDRIAERLNVSEEWVKQRWPGVLSSGLVRRLGSIDTVVKILI